MTEAQKNAKILSESLYEDTRTWSEKKVEIEQLQRQENATYSELKLQDGTTFGQISQYGYDAIINHTLDTYIHISDNEAQTIENFKNYVTNRYGKYEITGNTDGISKELCTVSTHQYFQNAFNHVLNYWYYPVILILLICVIIQMIRNRKQKNINID